jgi:hypothetical protein
MRFSSACAWSIFVQHDRLSSAKVHSTCKRPAAAYGPSGIPHIRAHSTMHAGTRSGSVAILLTFATPAGSNIPQRATHVACITVTTGARVTGRALARNGAVTLDTNTITATHKVTSVVTTTEGGAQITPCGLGSSRRAETPRVTRDPQTSAMRSPRSRARKQCPGVG